MFLLEELSQDEMVEKDILMEGQGLVNGPGLDSVIKIQDLGQFYFPNK